MLVCSSPQLIAAYHVLHRLSEPRHPPCALNCFKKISVKNKACLVFTELSMFVVCYPTTNFRPTNNGVIENYVIDNRLSSNNLIDFPICQRTKYISNQSIATSFQWVPCRCSDYESAGLKTTSCLKELYLWRISESNRWPPACKAGALASWANPPSVMILLVKNFLVDPPRLELGTSTLSV